MTENIARDRWSSELQRFTNRNAQRKTRLEVDDPDIGAQDEGTGYPLRGVAYDRRDDRIEIMLGALRGTHAHLTHTIAAPARVDVLIGRDGRDEALCVAHGGGQTLLRFLP